MTEVTQPAYIITIRLQYPKCVSNTVRVRVYEKKKKRKSDRGMTKRTKWKENPANELGNELYIQREV